MHIIDQHGISLVTTTTWVVRYSLSRITRPSCPTAHPKKVATERGERLLYSNYAPTHRLEAHPTQSPHITCSSINPVVPSTPFHDKPTHNYHYLLFCRIYSRTGPISQMLRVSGHMWANIFILNQSQNLSTRKVNSTVACISHQYIAKQYTIG